jgi:hypothetical protein
VHSDSETTAFHITQDCHYCVYEQVSRNVAYSEPTFVSDYVAAMLLLSGQIG